MVEAVIAVTAVWLLTTTAIAFTMITDSGWQSSDYSRVRAVVESGLIAASATLLPAAFILGMEVVTPLTTIRGRTLATWSDEATGVALVFVGGYLAAARWHGFVDVDSTPTTVEGLERMHLVLGLGMGVASLVAGFL
ncbi:hypothetical protein G3I44_03930 [Halogeometricum borinquense]|uniref:Uncharacterized protein n=1 Tax=Halogeometricum borinquense TaxID=60847 RepID=A0A6C0UDQ5_9EURY|nr:hypothetical protein [Halogeometricum borinquense]QIB73506.1 hypothetical protein G3I44_03930 [Halogeometricum borinquense]